MHPTTPPFIIHIQMLISGVQRNDFVYKECDRVRQCHRSFNHRHHSHSHTHTLFCWAIYLTTKWMNEYIKYLYWKIKTFSYLSTTRYFNLDSNTISVFGLKLYVSVCVPEWYEISYASWVGTVRNSTDGWVYCTQQTYISISQAKPTQYGTHSLLWPSMAVAVAIPHLYIALMAVVNISSVWNEGRNIRDNKWI